MSKQAVRERPMGARPVTWRDVRELDLDPLNPRLPEGMEDASQADLLKVLADDYDLYDLGRSLADNGYFSEEPLVVVQSQRANRSTVVEGNRRLAALRLLAAPQGAPKNQRKRWEELSASRKENINKVPVIE